MSEIVSRPSDSRPMPLRRTVRICILATAALSILAVSNGTSPWRALTGPFLPSLLLPPSGALALAWLRVVLSLALMILVVAGVARAARLADLAEARAEQEHKARTRAQEQARTLSLAVEQVPVGVSVTDCNGDVLSVNPAVCAMTGYSREEIAADKARFLGSDADARSLSALTADAVRSKKPWRGSVESRRRDGACFVNEVTVTPVESDDGESRVVLVMQDVTARRTLEEQSAQAQRIESLGRLAGGVAHDFNNLIGVIYAYTEDLLKQRSIGDPGYHELTRILHTAQRAADLSQQLLAFSRPQVSQPRVIDVNALLVDMEDMLPRLIGEDVELLMIPDVALGSVKTDPGQFEQVLLNLVLNARDAMPQGGRLTIEAHNLDIDEEHARLHPPLIKGRYVMLSVSDTGCGMDAATRARVFEPLFTTKPSGKGTGFGLATVYDIVQKNGGVIMVDSEPGGGTCFKVFLPRVNGVLARTETIPKAVPSGHETILLVEDQETARGRLVDILKGLGYRVIPAADGHAALELASRTRGEIDLLLTDVVLPGMSGRVLAEKLSVTRSRLRVLYMSGYPADVISHHTVLDDGVAFIEKPTVFVASALGVKVRETLDVPPAQRPKASRDVKKPALWREPPFPSSRSRRRSNPIV